MSLADSAMSTRPVKVALTGPCTTLSIRNSGSQVRLSDRRVPNRAALRASEAWGRLKLLPTSSAQVDCCFFVRIGFEAPTD